MACDTSLKPQCVRSRHVHILIDIRELPPRTLAFSDWLAGLALNFTLEGNISMLLPGCSMRVGEGQRSL